MSWRFQLYETGSGPSSISVLKGELFGARDKSLELILNRPGSLRFTISLHDSMASQIAEGTTCVVAYRDNKSGTQVARWSGPVWSVEENLADMTMSVSCVGWFEQLNKRVVRQSQVNQARYTSKDGGAIAIGGTPSSFPTAGVTAADSLLGLANSQQDQLSIARPTNIVAGTFDQVSSSTLHRSRTYQAFQNIGQAIQELSDVEAGFDYTIHPVTRVLNIHYQLIKTGSALYGKGQDRPGALFSMGWGPGNLAGLTLSSEMSTMANRVNVSGKFTTGFYEDASSVATHGFHEEHVALSDVVDDKILGAYATSEVAVRAFPRPSYSLNPFPWTPGSSVPRLFDDYDLGDLVYLRAKGGRVTVGGATPQAMRVFGVQIAVDNEGREQIGSIQTAPSS